MATAIQLNQQRNYRVSSRSGPNAGGRSKLISTHAIDVYATFTLYDQRPTVDCEIAVVAALLRLIDRELSESLASFLSETSIVIAIKEFGNGRSDSDGPQ